jgi:hypothetical protein
MISYSAIYFLLHFLDFLLGWHAVGPFPKILAVMHWILP